METIMSKKKPKMNAPDAIDHDELLSGIRDAAAGKLTRKSTKTTRRQLSDKNGMPVRDKDGNPVFGEPETKSRSIHVPPSRSAQRFLKRHGLD
jgi:hypothetical protein